MAALPQLVQHKIVSNSNTAASTTISWASTPTAGSLLILLVGSPFADTIATPTGWQLESANGAVPGNLRKGNYYQKRADGTETGVTIPGGTFSGDSLLYIAELKWVISGFGSMQTGGADVTSGVPHDLEFDTATLLGDEVMIYLTWEMTAGQAIPTMVTTGIIGTDRMVSLGSTTANTVDTVSAFPYWASKGALNHPAAYTSQMAYANSAAVTTVDDCTFTLKVRDDLEPYNWGGTNETAVRNRSNLKIFWRMNNTYRQDTVNNAAYYGEGAIIHDESGTGAGFGGNQVHGVADSSSGFFTDSGKMHMGGTTGKDSGSASDIDLAPYANNNVNNAGVGKASYPALFTNTSASALTLEVWVQARSGVTINSTYQDVWCLLPSVADLKCKINDTNVEVGIRVATDGFITASWAHGGLLTTVDGSWHRVAMVWDGSTKLKLYVDNSLRTTTTTAAARNLQLSDGPFKLFSAQSGVGNENWQGYLDDFAWYAAAIEFAPTPGEWFTHSSVWSDQNIHGQIPFWPFFPHDHPGAGTNAGAGSIWIAGNDADTPMLMPGPQGPPGPTGAAGSGGSGAGNLWLPVPVMGDDDVTLMVPGQPGSVGPTGGTGAAGVSGNVNNTFLAPFIDGEDGDTFIVPGNAGPKGDTGAAGASDSNESWARSTYAARPSGGSDDEFHDASIDGAWTRVARGGTGLGTGWTEKYSRMNFKHTANGTSNDFDALVKAVTPSVGDYIETFVSHQGWTDHSAVGLIMADGTTFGAGAQVSVLYYNYPGTFFIRIESKNNYSGASTEGTSKTFAANLFHPIYLRLKYEAANTWGMYYSANGFEWKAVTTTFAKTLTATQVGMVVHNHTAGTAPNFWAEWHMFRVNPAAE